MYLMLSASIQNIQVHSIGLCSRFIERIHFHLTVVCHIQSLTVLSCLNTVSACLFAEIFFVDGEIHHFNSTWIAQKVTIKICILYGNSKDNSSFSVFRRSNLQLDDKKN